MHIIHFNDLLQAARHEPLPQRLLFVFAAIELPPDSTAQQRADFDAGHGGTLTPIMCVDKNPQEFGSFAALCAEAAQFQQPWGLVFAAALSGTPGQAPADRAVDDAFKAMVENLKQGRLERYLAFDRDGQPVQIG